MAINFDKMKEKIESVDNRGKKKSEKDNVFFKPELGDQDIRFLPSEDGDPFKEFWFHYNIGTSVMCPQRNFGEKCPICNYATSLWQEGTDESKKMAKDLFARQRFFSNVLVRGKENEGPKPYGYGKELYKKLIKMVLDPDVGDFTDPDNGRDMKLSYEKEKGAQYPTSDLTLKPIAKPIMKSKKEVKDILDKIKPIDSFVEKKSTEEVRKVLEAFLEDPYAEENNVKKYGNKKEEPKKSDEISDIDKAIEELSS